MPLDPSSRDWLVPWTRVMPGQPAHELFDVNSSSGTGSIQDYLDKRRPFKGVVNDIAARNALTVATGDWVVVRNGIVTNQPQVDVYDSGVWKTINGNGSGGSGGADGTAIHDAPQIIGTGDGTTTTFTLPGVQKYEMVWVGGALQIRGIDYTVNGTGQVVFGTAPANGLSVMASCPIIITGTGYGGNSTPTLIGTGDGTNATYTLPGTKKNPTVWVNKVLQLAGTDYTENGDGTITFLAGHIPAATNQVVASCSGVAVLKTGAFLLGSLRAVGELYGMIGQGNADELLIIGNRTLNKLGVLVSSTPASGNVVVDVVKVNASNVSTTLATLTVACNGGMARQITTSFTPATLAEGDVVVIQIKSGTASGANDIRVWLYE